MIGRHFGSFRDASGFVYERDGCVLRQVNDAYRADYDWLMASGLYRNLVDDRLLVRHCEASTALAETAGAHKVIRPEVVPFISYPYEWCFSQLRDAALVTCEIQKRALKYGMSLKDASAYNIQFFKGRPILIDTLSFERYREGTPWVAYRQFCQHFLAPLALMSYVDARLGQVLRVCIDGIPLDLTVKLLPRRTYLNWGTLLHLQLHAAIQRRGICMALDHKVSTQRRLGRGQLLRLIESLVSTLGQLDWHPRQSPWMGYSTECPSYSEEAFVHKKKIVAEFIEDIAPMTVWDLGANTGEFSRVVRAHAPDCLTVAWDADPSCVETAYRRLVEESDGQVLPLVLDLTNPSPGLGWEHTERMALMDRGPVDAVLALALVHHLVIGNTVPFERVARFLGKLCRWLIIEFVPERDPQVVRMLSTRLGYFPDYNLQAFERDFSRVFTVRRSERIAGSERILFLMEATR